MVEVERCGGDSVSTMKKCFLVRPIVLSVDHPNITNLSIEIGCPSCQSEPC